MLRAERKLPAFTMLELLTGMIVSGIVLATLFTAYRIISAQAEQYRKRSAEYVAQSLLHSMITRDVLRSDSIAHDEHNLICLDHDTATVRYHMADSIVIREWNSNRDTFRTKGDYTEEYFMNDERDQHQP